MRCRGDFVHSFACDEFLEPDAFETCVAAYEKCPGAVFIYGNANFVEADHKPAGHFVAPVFDLLEYLKFEIVPPLGAGFFNRRLLGSDFYFDESISYTADRELFTRLGIKFGNQAFVKIQKTITNARRDEVSSSFRPESYESLIADGTIINDRLRKGLYQFETSDWLYQEFMFGMYAHAAEMVYSLAGDSEQFQNHIIAASKYRPWAPRLLKSFRNSRCLQRDPATGFLRRDSTGPSATPPQNAHRSVAGVQLMAARALPHWTGARIERQGETVEISTPSQSWHYAALIPIVESKFDVAAHWVWLHLRVLVLERAVGISLHSAQDDALEKEVIVATSAAPQSVYLVVSDPVEGKGDEGQRQIAGRAS